MHNDPETRTETDMDAPIPTLETLFEQLGLDSTPDAIDAFIAFATTDHKFRRLEVQP